MLKRKFALTLLLVGMMLSAGGCVAAVLVGGAAGTVAYVKGDFESTEKKSVEQLYNASLRALESLNIPVISKVQDALSAQIEGRNAEDKKVTVKIEAQENDLSKISIRIGTFGDQAQSRMIYDKIKEYL
ncbi:DUF3568 domain-containing protein [Planctomycetota bacterium]